MAGVERKGQDDPTLLEVVLRLHGDFRRCLTPIHITPLQAGVMLYLYRHPDAKVMEVAASLNVRSPTIVEVLKILTRKGWVTKLPSSHDDRALCLRLNRQGQALTRRIKAHVRPVTGDLTSMKEVSA